MSVSLSPPAQPRSGTILSTATVSDDIPFEFLSPGERFERAIRQEMDKPYKLVMARYFIPDDFARIQRFCDRYEDQIVKAKHVLLKHTQETIVEILSFYNKETCGLYEKPLLEWYNAFSKTTHDENWAIYKIIMEVEIHISTGLLKVFEEHHRVRLGLEPSMYRKDPFYKNICNLTAIYKYVNKKYLLKESLQLWLNMPSHMEHIVIQFSPMLNL